MLLWCDGFDHYGGSLTAMLDGAWAEIANPNSTVSLSTANPRTGAYAFRYNGSTSAGNAFGRRVFGAALETVGFGYAIHTASLPDVNNKFCLAQFRDINNAAQVTLQLLTTGAIRATRGDIGGTILGTSADAVMTAAAYQHFECRVTIDDTAGAVEVRINGVTVLDLSGIDTQATAETDVRQVVFGKIFGPTSAIAETSWDDMFAWDTTGSYNNDFIGDHRVRTLLPDDDTAVADWTVTGAATGWQAIGELAPDDDTSYIEAVAAAEISEFDIEDVPAEVSTISAVVAVGRMRKTDAGICNVQMSLVSAPVGSPPAPAVVNGADRPITEIYTYWQDVFEEDPATGAPWSRTGFNAALFRVERTA